MLGTNKWHAGGPDLIDDLAQDIATEFFATADIDLPHDRDTFEVWAFLTGKIMLSTGKYADSREVSENVLTERGEMSLFEYVTYQRPTQITHMIALDVLRVIGRLPLKQRELVMSIVDYGDTINYARDEGKSLFDAMRDLKQARAMMADVRALCDDDFSEAETRTSRASDDTALPHLGRALRDRRSGRTLAKCENQIRWVWTGEPPYEWGKFRSACRHAWARTFGLSCPMCRTTMELPALGMGGVEEPGAQFASIDHILARSLGGGNALSNMWIICYACNQKKNVNEKQRRRA